MGKLKKIISLRYPNIQVIEKMNGPFEIEYLGVKFVAPGPILYLWEIDDKFLILWLDEKLHEPNIQCFDITGKPLWLIGDTNKMGHRQMGPITQKKDGTLEVWNGAFEFDVDLETGKLSNPVYRTW